MHCRDQRADVLLAAIKKRAVNSAFFDAVQGVIARAGISAPNDLLPGKPNY
jgi:hypothetical protein